MVNITKPPEGKVILTFLRCNEQQFCEWLFQVSCFRQPFMGRIEIASVEILVLLESGPSLM